MFMEPFSIDADKFLPLGEEQIFGVIFQKFAWKFKTSKKFKKCKAITKTLENAMFLWKFSFFEPIGEN